MHVAGADGENECFALVIAEGEGDEEWSVRLVLSNRDEALLGAGMFHVWCHIRPRNKDSFNVRQRHVMLPALADISVVPIEACNLAGH